MVEAGGTYRPYRPSNGTEGEIFMSDWCARCALANFDDPDRSCDINLRAMVHDVYEKGYPTEWQYSNGGVPICTAFTDIVPSEPRCEHTIDMFD